ncbi:MAG: MFS transporter [Anaerolineae bacterium]|nr:MFS transporter [Anaerolineae bacterium]MDW8099250.1 MFS transporter [Anaerolineae bacterium]
MESILLLTVVLFLVFAASGATSPMLSLYLESLGADYARISIILTTYAIASLVASYAWGRVSDRIGRRKPLVVGGLWGMGLAFGLLAIAPSYRFAWGVRILEAVAMAAYGTASLAFMGDLLASNTARGRHMGSYRGLGSLSFALGAFGGGPIIQFLGMRQVYGLGALLLLAASLVAGMIREVPLSHEESTTPSPEASMQISRWFLAGVLLWTGAFWAAYSMWPNFLSSLGYPKSAANWLWGLAALSEVPFMNITGTLSDTLGRAPVLAIGGFGLGLVMLGYVTLHRWLVGLIGVQLFRGFAYSAFMVTSMIYAAESSTARRRAGSVGAYNVAMALGQILGLAIGGQIAQRAGFTTLFLVSTGMFLVSGWVFWALPRQRPTAWSAITTAR